jgi:hypothetical protein
MATWKKAILSGSNGELANLYVNNAVTASFFSGNGSAITGLNTGSNYSRITSSFLNFTSSAIAITSAAEFFLGSCSISLNNISSSVMVFGKADYIKVGASTTVTNTLLIRRNRTGTQVGQDAVQTFLGAASLPVSQLYTIMNFGIDQPFSSSLTYSLWTKANSTTATSASRYIISAIEMASVR